jgi:hypothetical protein
LLEEAGIKKGEMFIYTFRTPYATHFKPSKYIPAVARRRAP